MDKRIYLIYGLTDYESTDVIGVFDDEEVANGVCSEMAKLAQEYSAKLSDSSDDDRFEWRFKFPQHERYEVYSYPVNDWNVRAARRRVRLNS